jgi:heat shock transcription factor
MTTKVTSADFKPEIQQQLQQQLSLQSQSNQNLQLVLNSIIKKKRPIPAFLNKLYNMVADSKTDQYIHWSEEGTSFIVPNQDDFSKQVLPRFFKHNNFTSFIRQLNMYGFHKVPNVQQGSLLSGQEAEALEFANEYFIRDRPELLLHCSRRKNSPQEEVVQKEEKQDLGMILVELSQIKRQQLSISTEIAKMQRENQALWQQSLQLQQQYDKQKDTIEKIVGFLASVFHKKKLSTGAAKKRKLLLDDADSELGIFI